MIAEELKYLPAEKNRELLNLAESVGSSLSGPSGLINSLRETAV